MWKCVAAFGADIYKVTRGKAKKSIMPQWLGISQAVFYFICLCWDVCLFKVDFLSIVVLLLCISDKPCSSKIFSTLF